MNVTCSAKGCQAATQRLAQLKERHDEVVRHEQAHYDEAEGLAIGGPVLTDYVTGPDGKQYATGGHVMLDTSETGDPEEDLRRGRIIVKSAEAPLSVNSDLSAADVQVAARGRAMIAKNEPKIAKLNELRGKLDGKGSQISRQRLGDLAAGMGLNIPPGKLANLVA